MSNYIIDWQSGGTEGIPGKGSITLPEKQTNATATSLVLTGRGVANYGETQQENFLRLLEHFASGNPPAHPTIGQLWFDYSSTQLKLYKNVSTWDPVMTVGGNYAITGSWTFPPPTGPNSPVTKSYVDSVALGLQVKPAVEVVVTNPGDLGAFTYSNGTAGVGATLTANTNGAFPAIDGYTVASTATGQNGVLIAFTGGDYRNGRYVLTQVGSASSPWVLTRCGLCDEASEIPGSYTFVKHGTTFIGSGWVQTVGNSATFTVGTDPIYVSQFTNTLSYVAGPGISIVGNTISLQSGVVAPGTYTSVTVDTYGRVTAGSNPVINIDASQVVSGTLSDLRLSSNVALKNVANTFTANQTINSGVTTILLLNSTTNSELWFYSSAQPANNRLWMLLNGGTDFQIRAYDDPASTSNASLRLTRSGITPGPISTYNSLYVGELQTGVVGRINAVIGNATHTGYLEFINVSGSREGYIGYSATTGGGDSGTIPYVAGTHAFTGNVTATGAVTAFGNLSTSGLLSGSGAGTNTLAGNLSVGGNLMVAGSAPGRLLEVTIIDTVGITNYTPPAGTQVLEVIVVGGGGGGCGGSTVAGGGGGGAGAVTVYYRNPANAIWVAQVGSGGAGSSNSATSASPGNDSTVTLPLGGPTIHAYGGYGANGGNSGAGGDAGAAFAPGTSGAWGTFMQAITHLGHHGEHGLISQYGGMGVAGNGGASFLGRGGKAAYPGVNASGGVGFYGGGGGGGNGTGAGGNGGNGVIIFKAYG
jgi:hypothetical protein